MGLSRSGGTSPSISPFGAATEYTDYNLFIKVNLSSLVFENIKSSLKSTRSTLTNIFWVSCIHQKHLDLVNLFHRCIIFFRFPRSAILPTSGQVNSTEIKRAYGSQPTDTDFDTLVHNIFLSLKTNMLTS